MYAKTIHSVSFPKAWEDAVDFVKVSPEKFRFGGGKEIKHAVDSQCTIILDEHAVREVLGHVVHPSDPFATPLKLKAYIDEYSDQFNVSKFDYTYYDILKRGFSKHKIVARTGVCEVDEESHILQELPFNQIEALRVGLQKQVDENLPSNRNVATLWNPVVHTYSTKAQPCWNEVFIRLIESDHPGLRGVRVSTHFRSHDLSAWEANMVAIIEFLNRDVVNPCDCFIAEIVETNFSLHIYDYDLPHYSKIKKLQINPALQRLQDKYDRINCPTIFDNVLDAMEKGKMPF